ncbi:MAG TPA: DUF6498-containing protein [Burkholderiaceae bacterium]|nr:DUF6498-containing protein [Burkholderiaceae bacterium]
MLTDPSLPAAAAEPQRQRRLDAALAILSAAIIAYGVLALGWPVFVVMALFWFENVAIGGFNVLRMLVSGARLGGTGLLGALFMAAFFTVHYGLFTAVHGVFVVMFFGGAEMRDAMQGGLTGPLLQMGERLLTDRQNWIALLAIVAVHAVAFLQWLAATRDRPPSPRELMGAPYGRIVVLHLTLIAFGFLVMVLKTPVLGALLLIALKLAYDLLALPRAPAPSTEQPGPVAGGGTAP